MFTRIMVPLDGSFRAEQALPVAARIARATHASLLLVRVVTTINDFALQSMEWPVDMQSALDQEDADARAYLTLIKDRAELQDLNVTALVAEGEAARSILVTAHDEQADLIVMCSHGYTGFRHWVMGSIAQKVARYSPIPVFILRDEAVAERAKLQDTAAPVCIVVALDGSPLAEEALEPAASLSIALSLPAPGELHLARVLPLTYTEGKIIVNNDKAITDAQRYLLLIEERLSRKYDASQLSVSSSVSLNVDVAGALVKLAETGADIASLETSEERVDAGDIIALATHGRGGVERWIMGSIAERILSITKLPLLIVRPPHVRTQHEQVTQKKTENIINDTQPMVGIL
ncbi:MAG TPA: hypothetical protein DHW02_11995 [Ktedonobacter sp.]|nr:hypothetical protein [Ktedonobacter sp.]